MIARCRLGLCLVLGLTSFVGPGRACAQAGDAAHPQSTIPPPNLQQQEAEKKTSRSFSGPLDAPEGLIKLDVVVTDQAGKPVPGLTSRDFTLLDDGQPNRILSFQALGGTAARSEPPVEVIVVLDTLDIPVRMVSQEREEVERFLRQNEGHLALPVSVFEFSGNGLWTLSQPSRDGNVLAKELAHNREVSFNRAPLNAMRGQPLESLSPQEPDGLSALKALANIATAERRQPGRKVLLWIGPGWGIGSGAYLESIPAGQRLFDTIYWFSTLLREARITLYSFSMGESDPRAQYYKEFLPGVKTAHDATFIHLYRKVLAVQSGGRVLEPTNDPVSQMNSCVQEASAFYTLSFDPPPTQAPDEYHDLTVQVDKPGLTARTTTGYYDQPYYASRSNLAVRHISVEGLEQLLKTARGQSDADVARQLADLVLTERLSDAKLARWKTDLRGEKARRALVGLADSAAFLDPPPADIPGDAPPDAAAQQRTLALAVEFLKSTIPKLPNFYATRTTLRYEATPEYQEGGTKTPRQPLHMADRSRETVLYRNGYEVADAGTGKHRKKKPQDRYLITYGTFGPILGGVIDMIVPSGLTWSRWEQDGGSRRAVFRYAFPAENSIYEVGGCCLPDGDGTVAFRKLAGYHGEVAIDPKSGAVLRLTLQADLKSTTPLVRSDILIEYGPVEIGGKTYICPVRSVSISRSRSVVMLNEWDGGFRTYGPYATMLDDISFSDYHMFGTESRMLPSSDPSP